MKKILFLSNIILNVAISAHAQAPAVQWQKTLGGTSDDKATSVQQTTDGGYIVGGYTYSTDGIVTSNHGGYDYWVVKLSSTSSLEWQKTLGGTNNDIANSVQKTTDGGYIVAGWSYSLDGDITGNHGGCDYWVVKLSSIGNIQWQKTLGGSSNDFAYDVKETTDGGFIVAGSTYSIDGDVTANQGGYDYWVVKLSSIGNIEWQKALGGTNNDTAHSIQQTSDGGFIVAGTSPSTDGDVMGNHGFYDSWIVKLSSTGSIQWQKALGGTAEDVANYIQQTTDGGYIIAGYTYSTDGNVTGNHGGGDYWVIKLSNTGYLEWQKTLGGTNTDWAFSIQQTTDGGYIVAGQTTSLDGDVTGNHGIRDYWVIKLTSIGNIQWQKALGGTNYDHSLSIQQTIDGGHIVAGWSNSIDGDITSNQGSYDSWVVKLAPESLSTNDSNLQNSALIYPNPTKNFINITTELNIQSISISELTGKQIYNTNTDTKNIDISTLQNGIYLLKILTQNGTTKTEKIIKE
jgi:hypothetical protein